MREINRRWKAGRVQKHLCVRFWRSGGLLQNVWQWITGQRSRWYRPLQIAPCAGSYGNGNCYCGTGRTTTFRLEAFGWGFWGWLSRDTTRRPCSCEKIVWLFCPDDYADEIAEYGLGRLQAEFPGIKPLSYWPQPPTVRTA